MKVKTSGVRGPGSGVRGPDDRTTGSRTTPSEIALFEAGAKQFLGQQP